MRIRLTLTLLLTLLAIPATAAPKPDLSLRRYLAHTDFVPRAAQGGMSNPPIVFQNQGIPLGISFTVNCSTGMTCSFVNGVMTMTAAGGGGFPRLDQVLDPTADKTFAMGGHALTFNNTSLLAAIGDGTNSTVAHITSSGLEALSGNGVFEVYSKNDATNLGTGIWSHAEDNSTISNSFESGFFTTIAKNATGSLDPLGLLVNSVRDGSGGNSDAVYGVVTTVSVSGGIVNNSYIYQGSFSVSGGPTITNAYGLYLGDISGAANNWAIKTGLGKVEFGDNTSAPTYSTATNCSSAATPATCGSAAAGSVAVPTGITPTLVVNTTAITANSQILFTPDESLGTKLGVTCNSTIAQVAIEPIVTARTAATSFTIQYNTTITTNPICLSYLIIN